MLRETSAARTSSRSVACARVCPGRTNRTAVAITAPTNLIGDILVMDGKDRPARIGAKGPREIGCCAIGDSRETRRGFDRPYILDGERTDAHYPDPAVDQNRATRDQRDHHRRGEL